MAMAAALAKVLRGGCSAAASRPFLPAILRHPGSSPAAAPAAGMGRLMHTGLFRTPGIRPQGQLMRMGQSSDKRFFSNRPSAGVVAPVLESAWITARQIEAGRRAMARYVSRSGGKIWVRIFADKPVTRRPAETRMGRGKGSPQYSVAVAKPSRILYEMSGVSEAVARAAISIAASKMPVRSKFLQIRKPQNE
ncbi:unnamed protein product [Urochloa decumbens]|uniref:50S ribosomal protein L16, chloroplastic n=1 Tax=Urochloa decumbens TaxID=240449 RepID=A0ABC8VJA4_9POAL